MKTQELAVYLVAALATFATLFGFVPPLLNAHSTLANAIGAGVVVLVIVAAILTVHSTFTRNNKE